jgi:glycosyltransferase involved in cell wall biosynthesis
MVVTIHEAYVPLSGWRNTVIGIWQRRQLRELLRSSDAVIATCRERAEQTEALGVSVSVSHVPVGSNLEYAVDEVDRVTLSERLRGPRARPVVATFGNAHASRLLAHVDLAVKSLAEAFGELVVLNLGAFAPQLSTPVGVEVVRPGSLAAGDLSLHLSCADLVLLPFVNGAITNKTTLMAALQLGRPVLSTRGPSTDHILLDPGLCLIDIEDAEGYAATAVAMMRNHVQRDELGRCARALYERAFRWDVIAAQTLDVLDLSAGEALDGHAVGVEVLLDDGIP